MKTAALMTDQPHSSIIVIPVQALPNRIQSLRKLVLLLVSFLLGLAFACNLTNAQDLTAEAQPAEVSVSAVLIVSADQATQGHLIVTANVREGLHIYAQSQPKPFMATRMSIAPSQTIQLAGDFRPERAAHQSQHESLGIELHEFEGQIRWAAPVTIAAGADINNLTVSGELFAQACEAERCFMPKTYRFTATVRNSDNLNAGTNPASAKTAETADRGIIHNE